MATSRASDCYLTVILAELVDANGICKICGHDHSVIQPNTVDLKIRLDDITLEAS